jgi:hypothetical protein
MVLVGRGMPRPEVVAPHRLVRSRGRGEPDIAGQALRGRTLRQQRGMGEDE